MSVWRSEMFIKFIKKEMVLTISFVVALVSSFFVRPDMQYIGYIDFRTLSILFMLMLTMAGLQKLGIFKQAGEFLVYKARDTREMIAILVALSFFSAMVITNDVALITFVPFTIIALGIKVKILRVAYRKKHTSEICRNRLENHGKN